MIYALEVTARNLKIRVDLDSTPWPQARAGSMAREALIGLVQGLRLAIEGAPHLGIERSLVNVGPIMVTGGSSGPPKDTAPRVGEMTWAGMERLIRGVSLPDGVRLVEDSDAGGLRHRLGGQKTALVWLAEDRELRDGDDAVNAMSCEVSLLMTREEIHEKVMETAEALLESLGRAPTPEGGDESNG